MKILKHKSPNSLSILILLLAINIVTVGCKEEDEVIPEEPKEEVNVLKDKALFAIGAAVKVGDLEESEYATAVVENFDQISAEYEMKMKQIWSSSSNYNWTQADLLVDFAQDNNMTLHGHTLLWYREYPDWFAAAQYDSTAFETLVKSYITTVVERYKGKIVSWDVANEIFNDNGSLREDDFVYATFDDPIAFYGRCFQYVRDADPDVLLFYNDYSISIAAGKRYGVTEMVARFQEEGYPIDGIGDQFHYNLNTNESSIADGLRTMANTGLLIHLSELDLVVNVSKSNSYVFDTTEEQKQADKYQAIVEMYEDIPQEQKFGITTWGVTDKYTWLTGFWHEKEYPLLFNQFYGKKLAYQGFLDGLNSDTE